MTKINLGDFKVDALSQDEVISEIKKNLLKSDLGILSVECREDWP